MRVLHFAGNYFPVQGGATMRVHNMLASPDNEHILVVPAPHPSQVPSDSPILEVEQCGHISVRRVGLNFGKNIPILRDYLSSSRFVRAVRDEKVDILHGHNPLMCAIASLKVKRMTELPMVYEAHGVMRDCSYQPKIFGGLMPLNRLAWKVPGRVAWLTEREIVRAAQHVIAQTPHAARRLRELYGLEGKPVEVIYNGVDAERFDPAKWSERRAEIRERHGWGDKIVCLYAGYLDVVNGIEFLTQALPEVCAKTRSRLKIVLLGRGPSQDAVRRLADSQSDLVEYPGTIEHDLMPAYYSACDVFMIPRPSLPPGETLLPMKLFEAMAMKKLLLVSNVKAMADVISSGYNGLIFEKGDHGSFLNSLDTVAEKYDELEKLGEQARADILEKFTWDISRKQLQAIYESLVKR